jgi:predicted transposase YdaD
LVKKERQEGHQEGEQLRAEQTARNLIQLGVLTDEQIAKATGLSLADVQSVRAEDKH